MRAVPFHVAQRLARLELFGPIRIRKAVVPGRWVVRRTQTGDDLFLRHADVGVVIRGHDARRPTTPPCEDARQHQNRQQGRGDQHAALCQFRFHPSFQSKSALSVTLHSPVLSSTRTHAAMSSLVRDSGRLMNTPTVTFASRPSNQSVAKPPWSGRLSSFLKEGSPSKIDRTTICEKLRPGKRALVAVHLRSLASDPILNSKKGLGLVNPQACSRAPGGGDNSVYSLQFDLPDDPPPTENPKW
jgi:hypothetical protein